MREAFSKKSAAAGKVPVPPPDQLAFLGVLGLLAAVELIDSPVVVAIGAGEIVVARHLGVRSDAAATRD